MDTVLSLLAMLTIVAVSGLAARWLPRVPLPLIQIAAGALAAWSPHGLHVQLDPQIFMLLFIPPMLFADAWNMPQREFHAYRWPILMLSTVMVLCTVGTLGYLLHAVLPTLPLSVCFLLAAVLSPTDAVAVSSMVRGSRMPTKLQHILEGEALMNDAAALVAVKFAVAATLSQSVTLFEAVGNFTAMAVGGVLIGVVISALFSWLYQRLLRQRDGEASTPQILLLMVMPFAPYLIAEHYRLSGVLAVVAAGVTASALNVRRRNFDAVHVQSREIWGTLRFTLNGLIFTLVGLQLPELFRQLPMRGSSPAGELVSLALAFGLALSILLVLLALRFVALAGMGSMAYWLSRRRDAIRKTRPRLWLWSALGALGGTRGGITLAAVLGVPLLGASGEPFPGRDLIVFQASLVMVASLLAASVGLPWLLRRVNYPMSQTVTGVTDRARSLASRAALRTIESSPLPFEAMAPSGAAVETETWRKNITSIRARVGHVYKSRLVMRSARKDPQENVIQQALALERQLRLRGLQAERAELHRLRRCHRINDATLRTLTHEIDVIEVAIRSQPSG